MVKGTFKLYCFLTKKFIKWYDWLVLHQQHNKKKFQNICK